MALNPLFIVASDLEQYFVDKDTGLPLAGGLLYFWRDAARTIPKIVYQLAGTEPNYTYTALPNPIVLSSVGTVQNAGGDNEVIYYYPWLPPYDPGIPASPPVLDLYFVEVFSAGAVEQFTREAWPNITSEDNPETTGAFPIANQISNPQFNQVLINSGATTTYTVSGTNQVFNFAPDWSFVLSGSGTVIVSQTFVAGSDDVPTNPTSFITVEPSAGITQCWLVQTFSGNSGLWASGTTTENFLSGVIVAKNNGALPAGLQLLYDESSGLATPIIIIDASVPNGGWNVITDTTADVLPASLNTQDGSTAFVEIIISFAAGTNVSVTSVQVVPTDNASGIEIVNYDQNSANRELALTGDYYLPRLIYKYSPSLLVAWDFPLNPLQFGTTGTVPLIANAAYIADQTIAYAATTTIPWASNAVTKGLQFTTTGTNDGFAICQYLSGGMATKIFGTTLSVNVNAFKDNVSHAVTMTVHLYAGNSSATIPTLPSTLVTVSAAGVVSAPPANWVEIGRSGLGTATATLNSLANNTDLNTSNFDYGFTGWEVIVNSEIVNPAKFAIVVTFAYIDTSTAITVNSISLIPGDLPCRPAPQAFDEVLRECQHYYESSYDLGKLPADITNTSGIANNVQVSVTSGGGTCNAYSSFFTVPFNTVKRAIPTMKYYSPKTGTLGAVRGVLTKDGTAQFDGDVTISASFLVPTISTRYVSFAPGTTSWANYSGSGVQNFGNATTMSLQFVANAQLGVVA